MATLKEKFVAKMGPMQERVKKLNKEYGEVNVSKVDVGQVIGGSRDIISMLWDTSPYDSWVAKGKQDPMAAAREKTEWILKHHTPEPLPKTTIARLDKIVKSHATA